MGNLVSDQKIAPSIPRPSELDVKSRAELVLAHTVINPADMSVTPDVAGVRQLQGIAQFTMEGWESAHRESLQKREMRPDAEYLDVSQSSRKTTVMVIPTLRSKNDVVVGYFLPSYQEIHGDHDRRSDGASRNRPHTIEGATPSDTGIIKFPVAILFSSDEQTASVIWSEAGLRNAAFLLQNRVEEMRNARPRAESALDSDIAALKLGSRSRHSQTPHDSGRPQAISLEQFAESASDYLSGFVVNALQQRLLQHQNRDANDATFVIERIDVQGGKLMINLYSAFEEKIYTLTVAREGINGLLKTSWD